MLDAAHASQACLVHDKDAPANAGADIEGQLGGGVRPPGG